MIEGIGERLVELTNCIIPQNQPYAEQFLGHCLVNNKSFRGNVLSEKVQLKVDENFDWMQWVTALDFEQIDYPHYSCDYLFKLRLNECNYFLSQFEEKIEIYIGEEFEHSLFYGDIPKNKNFAEQLFTHCFHKVPEKIKPNSVSDILSKIRQQYQEKAPVMFSEWCQIEAATVEEISLFEVRFGEELPLDLKAFLVENTIEHFFAGNYECLSLDRMIDTWEMMNQLLEDGIFEDGRVERMAENYEGNYFQKVWWSKKWLPFCEDSAGNKICIDFDPAENGEKYQFIYFEIQQGPFIDREHTFRHFLLKHLFYLQKNEFSVYEHGTEIND